MVTIEPIVFTIRIGENNHSFGDPYTSVCTAVKTAPDTVRITAMVGGVTLKQAIQISKMLKEMGLKNILWERKTEDDYKKVELKR